MKISLFGTAQRKLVLTCLAIATLSVTSCKKMLDPDPKDVILDNEFLKN